MPNKPKFALIVLFSDGTMLAESCEDFQARIKEIATEVELIPDSAIVYDIENDTWTHGKFNITGLN